MSLQNQMIALRVIAQITNRYSKPCTESLLCEWGRLPAAEAKAQIEATVEKGLCERDGGGVWLTEFGALAVMRDLPQPVPSEALAVASEVDDI